MKKQLFEIQFRVHPTPEHPKFGEIKFGILFIWLYAPNAKAACEAAGEMARFLPYKIGAGKSFLFDENKHLNEFEVKCGEQAKNIGANLALNHWPMDADEEKTLGTFPYLIPLLNAST